MGSSPCASGERVVTFTGWDADPPVDRAGRDHRDRLFVTIVALIAFGVGALVRHTAGAIATVIALVFIVPLLENALPSNWHNDIVRFLPDAANQVVSLTISGIGNPNLWSAWPQMGVTALRAAALVAVGAYLFRTRDA